MIDINFWFDRLFWFESFDVTSSISSIVSVVTLFVVIIFHYKERSNSRNDYKKTIKELLDLVVVDLQSQIRSIKEYHQKISEDKLNLKIQPEKQTLHNLEYLVKLDLVMVHRVFHKQSGLTLTDCDDILRKTRYFILVIETFFEQHFRKREKINLIISNRSPHYRENLMKLYNKILFIIGDPNKPKFSRQFNEMTLKLHKILSEYLNNHDVSKKQSIGMINKNLLIPLRSIMNEYSNSFRIWFIYMR
jgi:hypothetical protein